MMLPEILSFASWGLQLSGVVVVGRALARIAGSGRRPGAALVVRPQETDPSDPVLRTCGRCASTNESDARFCKKCGSALEQLARIGRRGHQPGATPVVRTSRDGAALVIGVLLLGGGLAGVRCSFREGVTGGTAVADVTIVGPPGWLDVSPGAPAVNLERLPEEMAARFRAVRLSAPNVLIFVDPRPPAGAATFTGSMVQGGGPVGDNTIDDVVSLLAEPLKAALVAREYIEVAGRRLGHVRLRADDGAITDVYVVPGRSFHALLSYTIPLGLIVDEQGAMTRSIEATALTAPML
jgi:hypothetical protein